MMYLPWIAAGALAMSIGTGLVGYQHGGRVADARWQRQAAELRAQADAQRQLMLDRAAQLAQDYETERARMSAQLAALRGSRREATNVPIPHCPATVGDVVVPAAALGLLRRAAGAAEARPPTGRTGAPVQPRP